MAISISKRLSRKVRRIRLALTRRGAPIVRGCDLIAHFSYHKCLTVFYVQIMRRLGVEFGFHYEHCGAKAALFQRLAADATRLRVLSLNDRSDVAWASLPEYRGSHFVRDPRDLVVSGYFYHLWANEKWCHDPLFRWSDLTAHAYFGSHVEPEPARYPNGVSYQEYLRRLDGERGMIVELIRRMPTFDQMRRWNFSNPRILEMRYEDIVGHEAGTVRRLLEHYGFAPDVVSRGVELAERKSLASKKRRGARHVRSGASMQWKTAFSPLLKALFEETAGDVLEILRYERPEAGIVP